MFSIHVDTARSWRGGQNQVLLTVLGLRKRGYRAGLVAHPRGDLFRQASEQVPGLDLFPVAARSDIDLFAAWQFSQLLKKSNPDLIHAHDARAVAIASIGRFIAGRPLAPPLVVSRRVDFSIGQNVFSRWKYQQALHFLCASSAIQNILVSDGIPDNQTSVVYEGISLERIEHAQPLDLHKEFRLPQGAPVVGNIAALAPHKGQKYLVDAAALVVRAMPEVRFLIIGSGELEGALAHQIRELNLCQHVVLTGFRSDVLSVLKSLDIFVMSSVTEGLGTSILDAMAAGRAVVGTRAGGIPEAVLDGQTGLLVPTKDENSLADALLTLLRNPSKRHAFGRAGQERACTLFSAERMVDETAAAYHAQVDTNSEADNELSRKPHQNHTPPTCSGDKAQNHISPDR